MSSNELFSQKVPIIVYILIWYFRIYGITFGGLVFKNGECFVNKNIKIFGYIFITVLIIIFIILSRTSIDNDVFDQLYSAGFTIIYYLVKICKEIGDLLILINMFYYQFNGFNLFELLTRYQIKKMKYKVLVLTTLFSQLLILGTFTFIYFNTFNFITYFNGIQSFILGIYYSIHFFSIHFITWGKNNSNI